MGSLVVSQPGKVYSKGLLELQCELHTVKQPGLLTIDSDEEL